MQEIIKRGLIIFVDDNGYAKPRKKRDKREAHRRALLSATKIKPIVVKTRVERIREWYKQYAN